MCYAVRYLWDLEEPILVTLGDEVASFIEHEDETTAGWCLLDRQSLHPWRHQRVEDGHQSKYQRPPKVRLYSATSPTRWWSTIAICTSYVLVGLVLCPTLLICYVTEPPMKGKFGAVYADVRFFLGGDSSAKLILDVVVANSFQLALSTTYFLYNSLCTAQHAPLEWAGYANGERKGLRITWPRGQQRSTYYLQLPYIYGIPLTICLS